MGYFVAFLFFPVLVLASGLLSGCKTENTPTGPKESENPNRCELTDVGEASDFMKTKVIEDDVLILAQGFGYPQALVWRDAGTNKTYYLTRVMATDKRLYFHREIPEGETPGVPSRFEGHLLRWDHLPAKQAASMAGGLKSQYNVTFDPKDTYIIMQGQKPSGCP